MAKLVVLTEGYAGTTHELKLERTTIGRLEDNAFQLAEPSVSSHHCEIQLRGNEVLIKDLGSTNGTFINGDQVKEAVLKAGQILRLGKLELRLEDGTTPAATPGAAPAAAPQPKKPLGQTGKIPGGVKLNELEQGTRVMGSPFAKKSDKLNKIFLIGGVVVGMLIIGSIIFAISRLNN
jgi:pSer/pThr/pTyr-binding forkhead associated (FHA) protein